MIEFQNTGKIENRLDGTIWYNQDYVDSLLEDYKELLDDNHWWNNRWKAENRRANHYEQKIKDTIKDLQEDNNGDDYSLINVINILKSLLEE